MGRRVTSSWSAPEVPQTKVGTTKLRSAHLKVTLQVGCAPFPTTRSVLYPEAKPFPMEALAEQGTGSGIQICFPTQLSKRPLEALCSTSKVLKLFNAQAVAKQRLFSSNKPCRALFQICPCSMCYIHCCPGRWASALELTQITLLLSSHTECDDFPGHERSQMPTGK